MRYCFFLMLVLIAADVEAQEWNLKINKEEVKVYNRKTSDEKFDEIRVTTTMPGTPRDIIRVLMDVTKQPSWAYATKLAYIIKKVSDLDVFFYKEVKCPIPVSNRDLVCHLVITEDVKTNIVEVKIDAVPGYVPVKDGLVRVPFSSEKWTVIGNKNNTVSIDFYLRVDPGGSTPAFLANMFSTKGPFETFVSLRHLVASGLRPIP